MHDHVSPLDVPHVLEGGGEPEPDGVGQEEGEGAGGAGEHTVDDEAGAVAHVIHHQLPGHPAAHPGSEGVAHDGDGLHGAERRGADVGGVDLTRGGWWGEGSTRCRYGPR